MFCILFFYFYFWASSINIGAMLCGFRDFFERWSSRKRLWLFSSWVGFLYNFLLFVCSACVYPKLSSPVYMSRTITDSTTGADEVSFQVNRLSLLMLFFVSECKAYFGIFEAEPFLYWITLDHHLFLTLNSIFYNHCAPYFIVYTFCNNSQLIFQDYFPRVQNENKTFLHTTMKSSQVRSIFLDGLHYS